MEARIDRRAHEVPRMPLDVLVRLTHEDFEEPFDADGVDVSAGGLALRADYLPEVGDRLRCRFDCPPDGGEIEVDGEVVWAHDAGERSGEFGLRFTELDVDAEAALSRLVAHLGAPRGTAARARLHLEAVATPIDADVVDRSGGRLTVEQELPFLRIGMGVVVEGSGPAHGRLASVDLRVEDGVPRLLLVVEDTRHAREPDATLQDFQPPVDLRASASAAIDAEPTPAAEDAEDDSLDAPLREARAAAVSDVRGDHAIVSREPRADAVSHDPRAGDARGAPHTGADTPDALEAEGGAGALVERLGPAWDRTREVARALATRARPALAAAWAKVAAFFAALADKGGPRLQRAWARAKVIAAALIAKTGARVARTKGKRRTTAAPPRAVAQAPKLRRQREEAPPPKKKSRRVVVLSVLAFAGAGTAVYALSGGEEPAPPAPVVVTPIAAPPAPAAAPVPAAAPAAAPAVAPAPAAEAPAEDDPTPAVEAGRLEEPTYPTLSAAAQRASEGQSFGADEVPNGRSATIRMSQPVTTLRGERQPDGFTVTIPGALAIDRAGPIAAANPSIEQAMILNRGDHAVLTVRFVPGRTPAYRVVARGRAIEITVGR